MFNKLITPDIFYDINIPSELKHVFHEKKKSRNYSSWRTILGFYLMIGFEKLIPVSAIYSYLPNIKRYGSRTRKCFTWIFCRAI